MPTVTWLKDGAVLNETDYTNLRIATVSAGKASRIDVSMAESVFNGEYICVAVNVAGSVSTSFLIDLELLHTQGQALTVYTLHSHIHACTDFMVDVT